MEGYVLADLLISLREAVWLLLLLLWWFFIFEFIDFVRRL